MFPTVLFPTIVSPMQPTFQARQFTPFLGGSGGQAGQVYALQFGLVEKSGSLVVVHFNITLSTLGVIVGNLQLQSLPYPIAGSSNYVGGFTRWSNTDGVVGLFSSMVGTMLTGTSTAEIQGVKAPATGFAALVQADLTNASQFSGTWAYRT